jgi:hypothetical protein
VDVGRHAGNPDIYGLWTVLFGNYFFYRKEANDRAMVRK